MLSFFFIYAIFKKGVGQINLTCSLPLFSFLGRFHPGIWPLMLGFESKVFPYGILPSYLVHQGSYCPILVCESTPHLVMLRYYAMLVVLLRPSIAFRNIAGRCCFWKLWSYVSLGSVAMFLGNTQQRTTPFHELGIVVVPRRASCCQKEFGVHLTWTHHQ